MKTFLIIIDVLVLLYIIHSVVRHNNDIKSGKCPRCGAPLQPFYNENMTGHYCEECDWWEGVDNYGNSVP